MDYLLGRTDFPVETIAAHHDGEDWTEEELEEIERFKEFVRLKERKIRGVFVLLYDHLLLEASRHRIEVIERFMPSRLKL